MKKQKMTILTKARAQGWENGDDGAVITVETPKGTKEVIADKILVTVGRRPNSEPLADLGLEMTKHGYVVVNDQQQTSLPHVYAIGDITGRTMLAHGASYEAEVAAEVIAGHKRTYQARTVPAVVFTDPEIATAGLQEHEAKEKGLMCEWEKFHSAPSVARSQPEKQKASSKSFSMTATSASSASRLLVPMHPISSPRRHLQWNSMPKHWISDSPFILTQRSAKV